jgi:SRSO17 transposase
MTEEEITDLGPAFVAYLRRFRGSFGQDRTAAHFDTYCRGLLSDLPRKSIEPIAQAAKSHKKQRYRYILKPGYC